MSKNKLTLSVVSADVGGLVGHISSHPDILDTAKEKLYNAKERGLIADFHVLRCGDDLELILTHTKGPDSREINVLAWNTVSTCAKAAVGLKLHGREEYAEKDGKGPCSVEIEFNERASEPVVILMANKTTSGAWNLPLFKIFADPFNTPGLVTDRFMLEGFSFAISDTEGNKEAVFSAPTEAYQLLLLAGISSRYRITSVDRNIDDEPAARAAGKRLMPEGASSICPETPVAIIRCQSGLPAVGEAIEPFSMPHLVEGWMRGAHTGPLMPVPFYEAHPTRFDGPPRVIGAGFQVSEGRLIGPHDIFDDPSFDEARRLANKITGYMRRHGPFWPHISSGPWSELAVQSGILEKIGPRFK